MIVQVACSKVPAGEEGESGHAASQAPLWGDVIEVMDSRASDLSSPEGIAGTVGTLEFKGKFLTAEDGIEDIDWTPVGSVTLVARTKGITASHCFRMSVKPVIAAGLSEYRVSFPQEPTTFFRVNHISTLEYGNNIPRGRDLAVVTLADRVPASIVASVAPIFAGNLSLALSPNVKGLTLWWPIVVGNSQEIRRWGYAPDPSLYEEGTGPFFREMFAQPSYGAHAEGGDSGGALFAWNKKTETYALVGVVSGKDKLPGYGDCLQQHSIGYCQLNFAVDVWTALGSMGDAPANPIADNSEWVCDKLGRGPGEPCDPCLDFGLSGRKNSNALAEQALGLSPRPDVCDPTPIMRFVDRPVEAGQDGNPQDAKGDGPDEALVFSAQPYVGEGIFDKQGYARTFGFRYCACLNDQGDPISEKNCAKPWQCDPARASGAASQSAWMSLTVDMVDGASRILVPGSGGPYEGFSESTVGAERAGAPSDFVWRWYADAKDERIGNHYDSWTGYRTTQGFLASTVFGNGVSEREEDFAQSETGAVLGVDAGRAVLEFRQLAKLGGFPLSKISEVPALRKRFDFPYGQTLRRGEWVINNAWPKISKRERWFAEVPYLQEWVRSPALFSPTPTSLELFAGGFDAIDVGFRTCEALVELLVARSDLAFVDPVEPRSLLSDDAAGSAIVARASLISAGGWLVDSVESGRCLRGAVATFPTSSFLRASTGGESTPTSLLALQTLASTQTTVQQATVEEWSGDAPPLRVPAHGQAAFSAIEQAVYVVGGDGPGELGTVRRYLLPLNGGEAYAPTQLAPSGVVLGVGYDPLAQALFVLDVVEDGTSNYRARLVRHDLGLDQSTLLLEVPFDGDNQFFSVDVTAGGRELILMAATEENYAGWRLDSVSGALLGSLSDTGTVLEKPSMSDHELVVPLWVEDSGIWYRELAGSAFTGMYACVRL